MRSNLQQKNLRHRKNVMKDLWREQKMCAPKEIKTKQKKSQQNKRVRKNYNSRIYYDRSLTFFFGVNQIHKKPQWVEIFLLPRREVLFINNVFISLLKKMRNRLKMRQRAESHLHNYQRHRVYLPPTPISTGLFISPWELTWKEWRRVETGGCSPIGDVRIREQSKARGQH